MQRNPNFIRISNFCGRHGERTIEKLTELLNVNPPVTITEIAEILQADRANLNNFINQIYTRPYLLKPEVRQFLDEKEAIHREHYERQRRTEARILKLVQRDEANLT